MERALRRIEIGHREIVGFGESGERVRIALRVGRAEVGADQAAAVHRVEREFVDVDELRHCRREEQQDDAREE